MFKRAKVVMLPTNQKAEIIGNKVYAKEAQTGELKLRKDCSNSWINSFTINKWINYHFYFLSNEVIKEEDWCYLDLQKNSRVVKVKSLNSGHPVFTVDIESGYAQINHLRKIIATTDNNLFQIYNEIFNKGLPKPSQSFVEKYISEYNKGNIITDVVVEYENDTEYWESRGGYQSGDKFKIFTKPEIGEYPCIMDYYPVKLKINSKDNTITIKKVKDSWNREEVCELLRKFRIDLLPFGQINEFTFNKWVEENI